MVFYYFMKCLCYNTFMYLAIDIGGTKTLIALFNRSGRIVKKFKFKTPIKRTEFLAVLESSLIPFSQKYKKKVRVITIAVPGAVENNIAAKFGNRNWKNLDIEKQVKKLFSCPIYLENDANLATIYESSFHKGLSLYLTFSTGIGGGLARQSILARNSSDLEPGHTIYIWNNLPTEWEDIASCAAIGKDYGCEATSIRGEKAYTDIAYRVSIGLPELIQKYHPDCIIIGGPLGKQFRHIKDQLHYNIHVLMPKTKIFPRIVAAERPKESVIYGSFLFSKAIYKKLSHRGQ